MRTSVKQQIDLTIKFLVIIISGQKTTPQVIAKTLGVSVAWVFDMVARFKAAGLSIAYDQREKRYSVDFPGMSGEIQKLSNRLDRAMKKKGLSAPPVRFVTSLDRYTKEQFAQYLGTTAQNVQNMIAGYGGQSLPEGWVAFRFDQGGRWLIQKMPTDRTGKKYRLPENVAQGAIEYKIGADGTLKVSGPKPATFNPCYWYEKDKRCGQVALAHSLCHKHYWPVLRHPDREGKQFLRDLRAHKAPPDIVADVQKWVHRRKVEGAA